MAQRATDGLERFAGLDRQRCERVPQIMEAATRKAEPPERPLEAASHVDLIEWAPRCGGKITNAERIQRGAGVQRADYQQRLAFENRMASRLESPSGKARTAAQRIDELERLIAREKVKAIGMPTATTLFGMYALPDPKELAGESLFRLISGIAHAKVWSLYGISELGETLDQGSGRYGGRITANEELALGATAVAMRVARQALQDLEWYARTPRASARLSRR